MEQTTIYCDACQEAASNAACTRMAMCGISPEAAALRDLLVYATKGLAVLVQGQREREEQADADACRLIAENLVACGVNVSFDEAAYRARIARTLACRDALRAGSESLELPDAATFAAEEADYLEKAKMVGRLATEDPDIRGLRGLILYAMQGIAAHLYAAMQLGSDEDEIHAFIHTSLARTVDDSIRGGELIASVLEAGRYGIKAMNLLMAARSSRYGTPRVTEVKRQARENPGILVLGDQFQDLYALLKQSEGSDVDVYSYSEMLTAHAYPELAAFSHFKGHYGGSWWRQKEEFEQFNGPILVTSDEFTPPRSSYLARVFTTGLASYPGCAHIDDAADDGEKDFSSIIEMAKQCPAPKATEGDVLVTGYGREELVRLSDRIAAALSAKDVRKLVVLAGSDGRAKNRSYYNEFARMLPEDVAILTAGSVKFRFDKKEKAEIEGVPNYMDVGDAASFYEICNLLLLLQEQMNVGDVGMLPVYFNIAWYDPKSVIILLELLYIGMKNIHLGPSSLNFLSRGIREVFVSYFGLQEIGDASEEIQASFGERGSAVTADMIVGDIVVQFPELVPVMMSVGLHCLGCGVSQLETLGEACQVHGLDIVDVLEILNDELAHPEDEEEGA